MLTAEEEKYIRWYDYLWLVIPIVGIAVFVFAVCDRKERNKEQQ